MPDHSRRGYLAGFLGALLFARKMPAQIAGEPPQGQEPDERRPKIPDESEDPRLPDGKSQKNAIAKEQHEQALKDAEHLLATAQDLRDELKKSGTFVVSLDSVKKTEEIEKLAKRIRGRLKF